jgi:hypothetical protein
MRRAGYALLTFALALLGLAAAYYVAHLATGQGLGLAWQVGFGAAAYAITIALAGLLFGMDPADAVQDATTALVATLRWTLQAAAELAALLCTVVLAVASLFTPALAPKTI